VSASRAFLFSLLAIPLAASCARAAETDNAIRDYPLELVAWCKALGWDSSYERACRVAERACSEVWWNKYECIEYHMSSKVLPVTYRALYPNVLPHDVPEVRTSIRLEQLWSQGSSAIAIWYARTNEGARLLTNVVQGEGVTPWSYPHEKTLPCRWHEVPAEMAKRFEALLDDERVWSVPPDVECGEEPPVYGLSVYRDGKSHQVVGFGVGIEYFLREPRSEDEVRQFFLPLSRSGKEGLGEVLIGLVETARDMLPGPIAPHPRPTEGLVARYDQFVAGRFGWDNSYEKLLPGIRLASEEYSRLARAIPYFAARWPEFERYQLAASELLRLAEMHAFNRVVRLEWPTHDLSCTSSWVLATSEVAFVLGTTTEWVAVYTPGPGFGGSSPNPGFIVRFGARRIAVQLADELFTKLEELGIADQGSYVAEIWRPSYISWYDSGRSNQFVMYDGMLIFPNEYPWDTINKDYPPAPEPNLPREVRKPALEAEYLIRTFVMRYALLEEPPSRETSASPGFDTTPRAPEPENDSDMRAARPAVSYVLPSALALAAVLALYGVYRATKWWYSR
jgi:hypothetical protein